MFALLTLQLALAATPRIALLDISPHQGVSIQLAQGVTDAVLPEVRSYVGASNVVGAAEIRAMVGFERQKQLLGCTQSSCLAEIGGALGASRLITGALNRFGDTYLLTLDLVDARTARVVREATARFAQEGQLLDAVSTTVGKLFQPGWATATGEAEVVVTPALEGPRLEVKAEPHKRSHLLSIGLGIGGVVAAGFAVAGAVDVVNYQSARTTNLALTFPQAKSGLQAAQTWQVASVVLAIAAAGLGTAAVLTW